MPESKRLTWGETIVVGGIGCFDQIGVEIGPCIESVPGPVTIFAGRRNMRELGFLESLASQFAPRPVEVFDGIGPDPSIHSCQQAVDFLSNVRPACIIALGGGSVIDTAKVARFAAGTGSSVGELLSHPAERRLFNPRNIFVAVPTTAGTGSEVTPFATVWDFDALKKHSIDDHQLRATHAYLDARLTVSLSEAQTQDTAGDALAHAMESIWSRSNLFFTQALASHAIRLIVKTLPVLQQDLSRVDERQRMVWASLLAGMAISYTHTAAAHAISYPLTLNYGIPHGRAVANLLPHVLAANLTELGQEQLELLCDCFAVKTGKELVQACRMFLDQTGITRPLSKFGVQQSDIESIARASNTPGRLDNNIRNLSLGEIEEIITAAL
jgi:alcohol dehydrogenase